MPRRAALCLPALLSAPPAAARRTRLSGGWAIRSAAEVADGGAAVSTVGYDTGAWRGIAAVPATVLGALVDAGEYKNLYYDQNLAQVPVAPFLPAWWYRTEFPLPATAAAGRVRLLFHGVNYRANVWVNGERVADNSTVVGTFRYFDIDVTQQAARAANAVAVEVFRPNDKLVGVARTRRGDAVAAGPDPRCPSGDVKQCLDLAITWVDWAPTPPDNNMGLWRAVELDVTDGPVSVSYPAVNTTLLSGGGARVTIAAELCNGGAAAVAGTLSGSIAGVAALGNVAVQLAAGETKQVAFGAVTVGADALWWPWQMGPATLHNLTVSFAADGAAAASDTAVTRIGLREITKEIDERENALFRVNGRKLLIRGGGWAPDLLQRMSQDRHVLDMEYVRHLGLNTVRLEGKLQDDGLFDLADEMGVLMLPGWCCCDAWQAWSHWGDEQHHVATESLRSQLKRLRARASVMGFVYSSDDLPPGDVERAYLGVVAEERWPNPTLSSASDAGSPISGPSGVKMTGPYAYVPPGFWTDRRGLSHSKGGAFGFNTETSPGAAPMPLESLRRTTPAAEQWPIGEAWNYHCGAATGNFHSLGHFTPALDARMGAAASAPEYLMKAQAMAYEAHRAMFESHSQNKYNATGVIQWMLNNAWPSHVWHLYDSYFNPAGSYFGAKKALEAVHIQYDYSDRSVWVVNSRYEAADGLTAHAEAYTLGGRQVYSHNVSVGALGADGTRRVWALPGSVLQGGGTVLLRLTLSGAAAGPAAANVYWLSDKMDTFDWSSCNWYQGCAVTGYADFTDLAALPAPNLTHALSVERVDGEWSTASVILSNVGSSVAFFVRLRLLTPSGDDVLPVQWSDNYVTLFAGEAQTLSARFRTASGPGSSVAIEAFGGVAPPPPAACTFVADTDTTRDEYKAVESSDEGGCCAECSRDPKCLFACFADGTCYLKDTVTPERTTKNGVTLVLPK